MGLLLHVWNHLMTEPTLFADGTARKLPDLTLKQVHTQTWYRCSGTFTAHAKSSHDWACIVYGTARNFLIVHMYLETSTRLGIDVVELLLNVWNHLTTEPVLFMGQLENLIVHMYLETSTRLGIDVVGVLLHMWNHLTTKPCIIRILWDNRKSLHVYIPWNVYMWSGVYM